MLDHLLSLNTLPVSHVAADLMLAKSAANLVPFELLLVI